jgi:tRNA A58 N-methylase Trm61
MNIKNSIESVFLYKKKIYKVIFYEILYMFSYSKSNHFIKPPDNYPAPYYFIYKISKFINSKKITSIVDLGCGSGRLTNFMSDKTDAKIYGYEIDKESYHTAYQNKNHNVTMVNENILNIDYETLDVECFIFSSPLYKSEHLADFEVLINKIHKGMKKKKKNIIL